LKPWKTGLKTSGISLCLVNFSFSGGMGVPDGGAGGGRQPPPSLLGKQSQSGNIRSTVGQYWLVIKKKWDKFCQFCEKFRNIWKICMMFRKILVCPKNVCTPKMVH
jgi:hypothetical protein